MNLKKLVFSRAKVDSRLTRFTSVLRLKCPSRPSRGQVLWAIPQTYNEGSMFIHVRVFLFFVFRVKYMGFFFSVITVIVTFL